MADLDTIESYPKTSQTVRVLDGCAVLSPEDDRIHCAGSTLHDRADATQLVEHGFAEVV